RLRRRPSSESAKKADLMARPLMGGVRPDAPIASSVGKQVEDPLVGGPNRLLECLRMPAGASLGRLPASRVLDQDMAHSHCGDAEKVRPVLPINLFFISQPQVGLVNQVRGLQCVTGALLAEVITGQASQLTIDPRRQFIERGLIAIAPPDEQLSYGRRGCHQFLYLNAKDRSLRRRPDPIPQIRSKKIQAG